MSANYNPIALPRQSVLLGQAGTSREVSGSLWGKGVSVSWCGLGGCPCSNVFLYSEGRRDSHALDGGKASNGFFLCGRHHGD